MKAELNLLQPDWQEPNMLIDEEQNPPSEIEVEESKAAAPELPEKYRAKSLEEVIRMHQEAEKLIGKQAQEVGEVRKLADELLKQSLSSKQQPKEEIEPEVDFFEDPKKAVLKTVEKHPDVLAARQAAADFRRMQTQQKLSQEHPDYAQLVQDPEFAAWVKSSPIRVGLYAKADSEFDFDSANELLSTYKQIRGVKTKQTEDAGEAVRKQNLKTATVDVGGSGESSKRVYRRADLIRLKMTDPGRYESLSDEIMKAYAEGRVR
jgi:hypothetical protein